jgi:signal transduction histidine kinase/ligand-binding sensor domain-containing protein/DNA-binding NarL/FixJ family response regulator
MKRLLLYHTILKSVLFCSISILPFAVKAVEIERFEHFTTENGLSQNTITSIHCDRNGFLWFGTYNGLNRYDGYQFKVFQNTINSPEIFTNNRVISIWEDLRSFLWFETYDGYYHRYNINNETFSTLPKYLLSAEEKFSKMNCFHQHNENEIWLGSTNSGVYRLTYNPTSDEYETNQFLSRGQFSISNNNIRFIIADTDSNLYIGSKNGLSFLRHADNLTQSFYFQHFFPDLSFTCGVAVNNEVWMGTEKNGLVIYNLDTRSFSILNKTNSPLISDRIEVIKVSKQGNVLIGSSDLFIYQTDQKKWLTIEIKGDEIEKIFEDSQGILWVTNGKFGVQKIDQQTGKNKYFNLTTDINKYLSDKQRPYFYEDQNKNLWICLHGAGLAQYLPAVDDFFFYRYNPSDPKSISSNTIMCMTEDQNGTLWVGAGLEGGINKAILKDGAFSSMPFSTNYSDYMENIVRAISEDKNKNIWVASKGGELKLFDRDFKMIKPGIKYPFNPRGELVYNAYCMFLDSRGHMWVGSKGAGIAVSKSPINQTNTDYSKIQFYLYQHKINDSTSLCNNNIYTIGEDHTGRIWIGTYGGGLSIANTNNISNLTFTNIHSENTNLSNSMIRNIMFDSNNNLWVATTFGLNYLSKSKIDENNFIFECFYHDPENPNTISYNDVVHIFEDSKKNLWFGTFGGGVSMLAPKKKFKHYTHADGLSNNEVFGILEDNQKHIWLSTGNGLSRLNPITHSFDNYSKSNNLSTNSFSENTCLKTSDGRIVFGSIDGLEIINPQNIKHRKLKSTILFTQFQLFNKNIDVNSPNSPLKQSIISTPEINLKHNQSSFSVEYSAMNFLDESKTKYAYFLQNFDQNWNYVGTQRKASYTNLKPGKYTLKVKAALWNGNWDENESTLQIIINPPWWLNNNAFIAYLIVFIVSTFLVTRGVIKVNSFRNELKVEKAVNELKLQFFTNISHEIRTPLTLILGPIEDVLSDTKFPAEYRSTLQLMQKNGKRMLHLLNQLLDFRKVQNKKMNLKVYPVDIVDFTKSIYDNFTPHAQHMQVEFNFVVKTYPDKVWIDPNKIDSVVFNILSNAFKFTPHGQHVTLTIDHDSLAKEVYIKVTDSGPGIKEKDIPHIFSRYSILSGENGTINSTGIGLNLSSELVKMHGGEIRIESLPGKGCSFIVVLKTGTSHFQKLNNIAMIDHQNSEGMVFTNALSDLGVDTTQPIENEHPIDPYNKKTLLLVEDNIQILKYISDSLSAQFSILTAKNGREGLEIAQSLNPDLILSDIMMPEIDGIEMTRRLKQNFDTCHIPVILLTAKSSVDDQILGIESGAEAYVLKPFNMPVLKSMINNMLEQRNLILKKYRDKGDVEVTEIKFTSRNQEFLDSVISYIEKNYSNPDLSINTLVEHACVSRTVFYNKIKGLTGLSPIELMRQIKLKIAAQMLANGYNVNEAAYQIGFTDSRYFSKQFKELFGESPSQYKKNNQSE